MVICRFRYEIPHLYAEYILNTRIYIQDEILIYIKTKQTNITTTKLLTVWTRNNRPKVSYEIIRRYY